MGEPLYDYKFYLPTIRNILLPKMRVNGGEGVNCENDKPFALVVPSEFFEVCGCELRVI